MAYEVEGDHGRTLQAWVAYIHHEVRVPYDDVVLLKKEGRVTTVGGTHVKYSWALGIVEHGLGYEVTLHEMEVVDVVVVAAEDVAAAVAVDDDDAETYSVVGAHMKIKIEVVYYGYVLADGYGLN